MSITIKIEVEAPTFDEGQTMLEHIATQIGQGYRGGEGFEVYGEEDDETPEAE